MKQIGIITNFNVPEKTDTAFEAAHRAELAGARLLFPVYVSSNRALAERLHGSDAAFLPLHELYAQADAVFVVGGDGSVLEAAKRAAARQTPILGINRGRVGYMTELELNELDRIADIVQGNYSVESRFMLRAEVRSGEKTVYEGIALNDAVLSNGSTGRIVELQLLDGGQTVGNFRADGLIVSTPTGSTAYSLSAGGPVIDPRMSCFCITPICAHSPAARPTLFPDTSVLEFRNIGVRNPESTLTIDGKFAVRLCKNDVLRISDAGIRAGLIRVKPMKYYQTLYKKMD